MPRLDEYFLPTAQPAGLAAFADASAIVSSPRRFQACELEPSQPPGMFLDCIVSLHRLGRQNHFCVAHRWGDLSPRARDQFRAIAGILARQAIEFLMPDAAAVFHQGKHDSPELREVIRAVNQHAANFRFYRHVLPWRDLREQFCRVDMAWTGTKFIDPDWSAAIYASLPLALRAAAEAGPAPETALIGPPGFDR